MANENGIYPFTPNRLVCIIAAAVFGASALYHTLQMVRKKAWFYTPLVVGSISKLAPIKSRESFERTNQCCLVMTLGYVARYFSANAPADLGPYIIQSLFIILPPSLYAATIYIIFGRLVVFVKAPAASLIRPTRITKIFVVGDVIAFFMQAGGGGMMAQVSMADLGQKLMLVGLFVQLFFFVFFLVISIVFWIRTRHSPARYTMGEGRNSWYALLMLLLGAAVVIIFRCLFRIFEFAQGHDGYLASHEVYLYLFDALPMAGVQIVLHFIHAKDVFAAGSATQKSDDDCDRTELRQWT